MKSKAARISLTLPRSVLEDLEEVMGLVGYKKRSKAVVDAIAHFVSEYKSLHRREEETCSGSITFTYNHHLRGISEALTDLQHDYSEIISSSLHIHLDEENCLEVLAVRGRVNVIKRLIEYLMRAKIANLSHTLLP